MNRGASVRWSFAGLVGGIEQYVPLLGAVVLSILLAISASDQMRHFNGFVEALRSYAVVPSGPEQAIAILIILAEALLAVLLLVPRLRRATAFGAAALLGLFTVTVAANLFFPPNSTCGTWYTLTLGKANAANVIQGLIFTGLALIVPGSTGRKTASPIR